MCLNCDNTGFLEEPEGFYYMTCDCPIGQDLSVERCIDVFDRLDSEFEQETILPNL